MIIECVDVVYGFGGCIIGDGGCMCLGDVVKVFGGGVDFVMFGGMLVGYEEVGGEFIVKDGEIFMKFYGMLLKSVMDKYFGGVVGYCVVEGKIVLLLYCGSVYGII